MLYNQERHERLIPTPWDEETARAAIAEIVTDAESHFGRDTFWPAHPREDGRGLLKGLWLGAAGAIWALHHLAEHARIPTKIDLEEAIERLRSMPSTEEDDFAARMWPNARGAAGSFLEGELGVLLVHWQLTQKRATADRLFALISQNTEQSTDEMMWGAPGAAFAASFMWESTHERRWHDAFLKKIEELWSRWEFRAEQNCFLWTQVLYKPEPRIFLGPVHGFSGNACVMMRAAPLIDEPMRDDMYDRIAGVIKATVHVEGPMANWLPLANLPPPGSARLDVPWLVQWCHGAPGTLGAISSFPKGRDEVLEALFAAGGELTFAAGPLTKGPSLCHGTGGNGMLFLKLYERTADPKWLERARAFAMHGIDQYRRLKARHRQGWFTLWTGDLGFAVYLSQCISKKAGFPTMDFF
jgi:hypothetical protein